MLTYKIDEKREYDDVLLQTLRAHNKREVGLRPYEERIFYVYKEDTLVAGAKTSLSWDWVSPWNFFYQDKDALFALMNELVRYYKGRAVGINTSSFVDFVVEDFLAYGYEDSGYMNGFYQGKDKISLQLRSWETKDLEHDYKIVHVKEELKEEEANWQILFHDFIESCDFKMDSEEVQVVCLDDEDFVGGVMGYIQFGMFT